MPEPAPFGAPVAPTATLEDTLGAVEQRLAALGEALRARDAAAIDVHASALHRALASAVDHFTRAARSEPIPPVLRRRLALASGHVARPARVSGTCHCSARPRDRRADAA